MPATPMADSSAPMVVGIRHTSSAMSAVMVIGVPSLADRHAVERVRQQRRGRQQEHQGQRHQQDGERDLIRGLLAACALSTMAIMRSRKVSPGLTVTRTMIQSDSTRVPPVTAEKSPPDSRMTGADSPVMALSSTEAAPCDAPRRRRACSRRPRPAPHRRAAGRRRAARVVARARPPDRRASSPTPSASGRAAPPPAPCCVPRRAPRQNSRTAP